MRNTININISDEDIELLSNITTEENLEVPILVRKFVLEQISKLLNQKNGRVLSKGTHESG